MLQKGYRLKVCAEDDTMCAKLTGVEKKDAKDVIITIGGFILGPLYAVIVSVIVSVLEFFTVSGTGPIGLLMNIISTAAFSYTACIIYKKNKKISGAFLSLGMATLTLTVVMLLWNYYITPLYMKIPREVIIPMLPTVFLPFNMVKGLINSGFILFTYKPVVSALQKANLISKSNSDTPVKKLSAALVVGIILVIVFIPVILNMANIL